MQRLAGIMLVVAVGSAALAGCALRDPRDNYAYGGNSDGLWNTSYELIDWNFPTSVNQGPIERPERFRLERTAIGVTWATRNPLPLSENIEPQHPPLLVKSNDDAARTQSSSGAGVVAGDNVADRERRGAR